MLLNNSHSKFALKLILIGLILYPLAGFFFTITLLLFSLSAFFFFKNNIIHSSMLLLFNISFNWFVLQDHTSVLVTYLLFLFLNYLLANFTNTSRLLTITVGTLFLVIIPFWNLDLALKLSLFSMLFITNIIPLLFALSERSGSKFDYFKTCFSPWNLFCVFLSPLEIATKKSKNTNDYLEAQTRALKLAVLLLCITLLKNGIIYSLKPNYSFWSTITSPSIRSNFSLFEIYDLYLGPGRNFNFLEAFLVAGFLGTMRVLYVFGAGILLANIFGINVPLMPKSWLKVDTFKSLILNLYHYYNRVIVKLFFIPLYKHKQSIITSKNKNIIKVLAIIIGGLFFHAIGDFAYHTFYDSGHPPRFHQVLVSYLAWVIYFIALLIFIYIDHSLQTFKWHKKLKQNGGRVFFLAKSLYLISLLFLLYVINLKIYIPTLGQ